MNTDINTCRLVLSFTLVFLDAFNICNYCVSINKIKITVHNNNFSAQIRLMMAAQYKSVPNMCQRKKRFKDNDK